MNLNDNKNEFEILDSGNLSYQPRYPLANVPGYELQNMGYKGWRDMCPDAKRQLLGQVGISPYDDTETLGKVLAITTGIVAALAGVAATAFPPLAAVSGVFGIISMILDVLWPESDSQVVWGQFAGAAEALVGRRISDEIKKSADIQLRIAQSRLKDYQQASCNLQRHPNNEVYKELIRDAFDDADDALKDTIKIFSREGYELLLLLNYVQVANLHLLLLKDVVRFGVGWGFPQQRVEQYYSNPTNLGSPGMVQLLAEYTNHSTSFFWQGVREKEEQTRDYYWNQEKYDGYRSDMTMMVLDMIAIWPTYDPRRYPYATEVQLTRNVYSTVIGAQFNQPQNGWYMMPIEYTWDAPPRLVRWIQEFNGYTWKNVSSLAQYAGTKINYKYTTGGSTFWESRGIIPSDGDGRVWSTYYLYSNFVKARRVGGGVYPKYELAIMDMVFPDSGGGYFTFGGGSAPSYFETYYAPPCENRPINANNPDVCTPNEWLNAPTGACLSKGLKSHMLADVIPGHWLIDSSVADKPFISTFAFAWRSTLCEDFNTVQPDKIGQFPAVKANWLSNDGARVVRSSGNTGGDLVRLNGAAVLKMDVQFSERRIYIIRIRYATIADDFGLNVVVRNNGDIYNDSTIFRLNPTSNNSTTQWTFENYGYQDVGSLYPNPDLGFYNVSVSTQGALDSHMDIDKIEFIPIEESLEEYLANQDIEKASKAVNALFTSDAKNALKLNITDYAVDQAARLVECVSKEFYAQEKIILLDQVKFAKRLSRTRNLLNYGDFESPDWSGENGWKTSSHVHVASDNPIFKGRYLHMPGANYSRFDNKVFPTYVYQKIDESKLKPYTRYLVRGFVGNSKDLELLVERYGKDVHVEMDVPNDIQYTLPMNDCGGFDRCQPVSHQTASPHTCTCKDTTVAHTDCQCKDKGNRTSTGMYTNGHHSHKSCGCKGPHVFSYHIDTGCVDQEENLGLWFALKVASENGVANIDNLEIIEAQPLTGE
ncbi:insecticidal delta-endotoxin Cry8Ea1 family protein, partial [Bacillus toyonensis]